MSSMRNQRFIESKGSINHSVKSTQSRSRPHSGRGSDRGEVYAARISRSLRRDSRGCRTAPLAFHAAHSPRSHAPRRFNLFGAPCRHPDAGEPFLRSLLRHAARRTRFRRSRPRCRSATAIRCSMTAIAGAFSGVAPFHLDSAIDGACVPISITAGTARTRVERRALRPGSCERRSDDGLFGARRHPVPLCARRCFTICDHYFCSVMGPTNPNRLYLWSGTIDPRRNAGGPVIDNHVTGFRWTTYPERLEPQASTGRSIRTRTTTTTTTRSPGSRGSSTRAGHAALTNAAWLRCRRMTGSTAATSSRRSFTTRSKARCRWFRGSSRPKECSEHPAWPPAAGAHFIAA